MIETYTLTTADADRWRAVVPADVSVGGSLEYVRICEQQSGWPARLFVVEREGTPIAAIPLQERDLRASPRVEVPFTEPLTDESIGPLQPAGAPLARADTTEEHKWSI